jgi:hypothetical protein
MPTEILTMFPSSDGALQLLQALRRAFAAGALVALSLAGADATAQSHAQRHLFAVNRGSVDPQLQVPPPPGMIPLQAALTQGHAQIGANADGSDLWPCFGHSPVANPDCPSVGNPSLPLPHGAMTIGVPAYSWALKNDDIIGYGIGNGVGCDAFVNGTTGLAPDQYNVCGQFATIFEDDTNDANDDLLQRIVVTQGLDVIYDTGIVDFGPAGPTVKYPVDVLLAYDANFGYWPGAKHGPNNGNCTPDIGYPLTAPAFPGFYQVAAGSTCSRPVAGKARVHSELVLATPTYHQQTGDRCTNHGVASPCYTVTWKQKYQVEQDWEIFFM